MGRGGREGGRERGGRERGGRGGREGRDECYTYYSDGTIYGPFLLKLLVSVKIMYKKKVFQMCNKCCQGCSGEH